MSNLKELRALLDASTPGPWRWVYDSGQWYLWDSQEVGGPGEILALHTCEACASRGEECQSGTVADRALIAALRNAAPALLDVVEAANGVVSFVDSHTALGCPWGCDGATEPPCVVHELRDSLNTRLQALGVALEDGGKL